MRSCAPSVFVMEKRKWLTWFTNSLPWSEISTLVHPYLQKTYTATMVIQIASKKAKQVIKKKVTQEFWKVEHSTQKLAQRSEGCGLPLYSI